MQKYSITYNLNTRFDDSSYISVNINEPITSNESYGDQIGIYKEGNVLEWDEFLDLNNTEIIEFIKTYFDNYRSVLGFIRRVQN